MSRLMEAAERTLSRAVRPIRRIVGGWAPRAEDAVSLEDLNQQMYNNAIPSIGFFLMLALSAVIATLGLIGNSAPAIIGAMIIAPLMAPIVSAAYGTARMDGHLIVLSSVTIVVGTLVVIAIAYVGVAAVGLRIAGTEILARTAPSFLDLGVALAAGCAGAFAQTRPSIANSIAGVAIAVALVPPLAVTGIGLSLGREATGDMGRSLVDLGFYAGGNDIAFGAFLLFLTNLVGIIFVAALVFIAQRYGNWRKALAAILVIAVASFFLLPPLERTLHQIYVKNRVVRLHVERAGWLIGGAFRENYFKILDINVSYRNNVLNVKVEILATQKILKDAQRRLDDFRTALSAELGEPVVMEVAAIPVDTVILRSATPVPGKVSEKAGD